MSLVSIWRDNLNIGIYLTQYGAQPRESVLQHIGYSPGATDNSGNFDHYYTRLRATIDTGAQKYTEREPGWFFIGAFPFGGQFLYRTTWYVNRDGICVPLAVDQFVDRMKEWRTKDTNTRIARTRASVAADALYKIRRAMRNGDEGEYNSIIQELAKDKTYGPIMEIVTGHYGVQYAEMIPFIELLLEVPEHSLQRIGLSRSARDIRTANRYHERGVRTLASTLTSLVMIKAGQRNPKPRVLEEARNRLASFDAT
jgi:hypothetical protein